jgi:hypothetical protein
MTLTKSVAALYGACLVLGFCPEDSVAATATNLVTICTSATTTIQASKCTAWQYNYYSPTAYIESYPQVSPGPTGYTDPNYEYRLADSITPNMGVKVCPTALTPGTSFTSTSADPCPNNKLVSASTVLPSHFTVAVGQTSISAFSSMGPEVTPLPGSPYSLSALSFPYPSDTTLLAAAMDSNYLYVLSKCCSAGVADVLNVYGVSRSGLTLVPNIGGFPGTPGEFDSFVIAMFATQGYLYIVADSEEGGGNSFLHFDQISPNTPPVAGIIQLSCGAQSAVLDSAAAQILINCGMSTEVISIASPGNPVEVATWSGDASAAFVGN